ncbi:EAL domain-containing protein [Zoogloea sp.]|uniref:EAL domain-containing protein n=1 Tax=Zoogloea sp. TaxID=49181 RepID=UPI00344DFAF7
MGLTCFIFRFLRRPLTVSASLGVTFYPQDGNVDADQLIRQADQAMYQAKLAGKNRYHAFDMGQDVSIRRHHEGLERLRLALDRDEFVLHFQPKVNMCSGAVIGAEALIRWHHPEKGMLAPAAFLPLLEGHALAVELGEWVIDTALSELETWQGQGLEIGVSVNVGASQLQQADFVERLQHLLSRHPGVKPGSLSLEVLETSALGEIGLVSSTMRACRSLGVGFELDDFGTGYSSLTYLKHLPVATLKIDQSFVRDMLNEPDDIAILESVLDLSAAFDKTVIAEGVETLRQGELLLLLGCRLAQGYGIARPMPATDLPAWVARWQPDVLWQVTRALSQDRRPLLRAAIKHHAWIHAISRYLRGESPSTPPLSPSACAFGKWLQSDSPIRQAIPSQVDTLHLEIHRDAAALLELQAQGRSAEAIAGIPHLQAQRDTLINALKSLL